MDSVGFQVERSVENLWQCMAQSKRPLGLLLGAGCPASIQVDGDDGAKESLIPTIDGLTRRIEKTMASSGMADDFNKLVAQLSEDSPQPPNLEQMLSNVPPDRPTRPRRRREGGWIKILLHHMFLYKAKLRPGWSLIPE